MMLTLWGNVSGLSAPNQAARQCCCSVLGTNDSEAAELPYQIQLCLSRKGSVGRVARTGTAARLHPCLAYLSESRDSRQRKRAAISISLTGHLLDRVNTNGHPPVG